MRGTVLATLMLCLAVNAAAQSHDAPKPEAKAAAPAGGHAPAAKAAGGGDEHAAPAAAKSGASRPAPVVSSITAAAKPTARAEAGGAEPAVAAKKPKPLVSGAKAAGHEEEPAGPRVSGSPVLKTAAAPAHGAPAAAAHGEAADHDAPAAAASAPAGVNPKAPAKLSTVHGRITAALAELRAETAVAKSGGKHEGGKSDSGGDGHGEGKGAAPVAAGPRFVVSWPAVRWRVAWRDDRERVTVAWP